ncbi:hypothetical protein Tco_0417626 [Tanacetum coccineum]
MDLNMAVWNIRGMCTSDKQKEVRSLMNEEKLQLCGIIETHVKYSKILKIDGKAVWNGIGVNTDDSKLMLLDTHNMIAFLSKPEESDGFEQIVNFLKAQSIKYALTVNPTIYTSCIEQFWSTVKAKTINGEVQLHALVDGKKIIVTESTVRRDLQLEDAEGIDCLPNSTIFEELTRMGYGKISQKLTFNKAFFFP